MLELRNVTKKYSAIPAVRNVSFALKPGEITGYLVRTERAKPRQSK
jgi:ABC-2 type transport system ATP-binding protein